MFGLFIGTLCLIGLFATLRRRRHAHFFSACGPDASFGGWDRYGHGPSGGHPGFRQHRHARGPRARLYNLFRRLDATPGQEKALLALAEGVAQHTHDSRKELDATRRELAASLAGDMLDLVALDAAFARGGELFTRFSRELKHALAQSHELLDPEQRSQLAEWIADGSFSPNAYRC